MSAYTANTCSHPSIRAVPCFGRSVPCTLTKHLSAISVSSRPFSANLKREVATYCLNSQHHQMLTRSNQLPARLDSSTMHSEDCRICRSARSDSCRLTGLDKPGTSTHVKTQILLIHSNCIALLTPHTFIETYNNSSSSQSNQSKLERKRGKEESKDFLALDWTCSRSLIGKANPSITHNNEAAEGERH